ncbi:MAG: hypothetical protein SVR81_06825 [Chloroflexota bacterium]|nr:hypothetical protein [Chloroflexota bacterium]
MKATLLACSISDGWREATKKKRQSGYALFCYLLKKGNSIAEAEKEVVSGSIKSVQSPIGNLFLFYSRSFPNLYLSQED